jgi:hypothetical protein
MDPTQSLTEWAQQMAATVQHKARAKEHRHQAALLNQAEAEQVWVDRMNQVVRTCQTLVQALKRTGQFPELALLLHAQSPQGTVTYMRRGTLFSLKGIEKDGPAIEFVIDPAPPFRPDLLTPTIRVITNQDTERAGRPRQEQFRFGVTPQGVVVWHLLHPTLQMPPEGSVEEMLRSFLASLLLTE